MTFYERQYKSKFIQILGFLESNNLLRDIIGILGCSGSDDVLREKI